MVIGDEVMVADPTGDRSPFVGRVWWVMDDGFHVQIRDVLTGDIGTFRRKWVLVRKPFSRIPKSGLGKMWSTNRVDPG
jgi:hypothetical protein